MPRFKEKCVFFQVKSENLENILRKIANFGLW